jgi:heme exporter protein CcmD
MPFIVASYAISALVLLWAALTPTINRRNFLKQLRARQLRMDKNQ